MKKIALTLLLLSSSLLADRYMMAIEYSFIKGCTKDKNDEGIVSRCICTLTELQKNTSQAEMIDLGLQVVEGQELSKETSSKLVNAALKCVDR